MPRTCIGTADAIELTETLQLIARWLADDPEFLLGEDRPNARSCRQPSTQLRLPARSRDMVGAGTDPDRPREPSVTPLITTDRLELRPFRDEDAAELHEIFSDPETHTIGDGPLTCLAQTAAWISRAETEREHGLLWYAVRARA